MIKKGRAHMINLSTHPIVQDNKMKQQQQLSAFYSAVPSLT